MNRLQIKRVYEASAPSDGYRILIDRLWPRGIPRRTAHLDDWARAIAPSTEARKAFGHEPANMESFRARYLDELAHSPESSDFVELVAEKLKQGNVTLLYAALSETVNHAVILRDWLLEQLGMRPEDTSRMAMAGR